MYHLSQYKNPQKNLKTGLLHKLGRNEVLKFFRNCLNVCFLILLSFPVFAENGQGEDILKKGNDIVKADISSFLKDHPLMILLAIIFVGFFILFRKKQY